MHRHLLVEQLLAASVRALNPLLVRHCRPDCLLGTQARPRLRARRLSPSAATWRGLVLTNGATTTSSLQARGLARQEYSCFVSRLQCRPSQLSGVWPSGPGESGRPQGGLGGRIAGSAWSGKNPALSCDDLGLPRIFAVLCALPQSAAALRETGVT